MSATFRAVGTTSAAVNTTVNVTKPAGTVTGDVVIAIIAAQTAVATMTPGISGWTLANGAPGTLGGAVDSWTFYRIAEGGDPGTYTFTADIAADYFSRATAYQDAAAVNASAFSTSGVTTTPAATGVTTTVDGCTIVAIFFALGSHGTTTAASGFTNRYTDGDEAVMDMVQLSAGATGTVTPSFSDSDQWWMSVLALEPVTAGGAPYNNRVGLLGIY
jgi:hypothetical protein